MSEFLWHKVSEEEKVKIQEQAKRIMDSFATKLEKVEKKLAYDEGIERKDCDRNEMLGAERLASDNFSRDLMFKNAPESHEGFVVAEKKTW
jgi:Asp-tRNA(Asn)/Glu-tRNA(Gln) amidotransferase C subunit